MAAPDGYIYIVGWDRYQHYKNRRPSWIKAHTDLIHNDAYLRLSPFSRALLHGVWLLVAEQGQGRVWARSNHLLNQLNIEARRGQGILEPLIEAGFIEVRASKLLAPCKQVAPTETETETELVVLTNNEVEEPAPPHQHATPPEPPGFIVDLPKINSTNGNGSDPLGQLTAVLDTDDRGAEQLRRIVATRGLSEQHLHRCRERILEVRPRSPIAYAIQYLRKVAA